VRLGHARSFQLPAPVSRRLRERHAFEAQVDVVLYPCCNRPQGRGCAPLRSREVTVEAVGQSFLLGVGTELCQKQSMLNADVLGGECGRRRRYQV